MRVLGMPPLRLAGRDASQISRADGELLLLLMDLRMVLCQLGRSDLPLTSKGVLGGGGPIVTWEGFVDRLSSDLLSL